MKLKTEVDVRLTARAVLSDDGELSLRVIATAIYDADTKATTSANMQVPEDVAKDVRRALEAAIKSVQPAIHNKVMDAIHTSRSVALAAGEIE